MGSVASNTGPTGEPEPLEPPQETYTAKTATSSLRNPSRTQAPQREGTIDRTVPIPLIFRDPAYLSSSSPSSSSPSQGDPNHSRPSHPSLSHMLNDDFPACTTSTILDDEVAESEIAVEENALRGAPPAQKEGAAYPFSVPVIAPLAPATLTAKGREGIEIPTPRDKPYRINLSTSTGVPERVPASPRGKGKTGSKTVERLMPLFLPESQPTEKIFLQLADLPTRRAARPGCQTCEPKQLLPPRREDEMVLEQFGEFTDDDSFFSSDSSVISEDEHRMESEEIREAAVLSVHQTVGLPEDKKFWKKEEWVSKEVNTHWLYQVHHRAICLNYSSFFIFPARWVPRVVLYNIMHHWACEFFIFCTIVAYSIFQACWVRSALYFPPYSVDKPFFMMFADVLFTSMLGLEIILRLFTCGLLLHPRAFFRSFWRWLDVTVLVLMIFACTNSRTMWNYTAWRLLRVLVCCRYCPYLIRMKVLVKVFLRSTSRLISLTLYWVFFILFFALLGLHLFKNELQGRCANEITGATNDQICNPRATDKYWFYWGHRCEAGYTCMRSAMFNPHDGFRTFDDVGHALISTFQIVTIQGWSSLRNEAFDAMNTMTFLFYFFAILICTWIVPSMYIGVFMERILIVRRRYFLKQISRFKEMMNEQRHRQNANIRLTDYQTKDAEGRVPCFPSYHTQLMDQKIEKGLHKPIRDVKWSDESRIQLHLSLSRQAELMNGATSNVHSSPKPNAATSASSPLSLPSARAKEFVLGGTVGKVQHHPGAAGVGEAKGTEQTFAMRQQASADAFAALQDFSPAEGDGMEELGTPIKGEHGDENNRMRVLKAVDFPGVTPGVVHTGKVVSLTSDSSEDSPVELLVQDPEGGDFKHAPLFSQRWSIIRNMAHMVTEGYPRVVTAYLWRHMLTEHRYRLRPLHCTIKYEEEIRSLLRRRRLEEIRDIRSRHQRGAFISREALLEGGVADGMDGSLMPTEDVGLFREDPHVLAERIVASARPTWWGAMMYVLIFINGGLNATRYLNMPEEWESGLLYLGIIFSVFFFIDQVLRLVALGPGPYVLNVLYPLEMCFIILSFFQLGFDRSNAITVFNWYRFIRLASVCPITALRNASRVLLIALPDLCFGLFFFFVYMFMWLLIGMSLFGGRFEALIPPGTDTRGSFNNFSFAMYAIAQAFSNNRDHWLYLSWEGMRARSEVAIMYFMPVVGVALMFRFFFIAICTAAWNFYDEQLAKGTVDEQSRALEELVRMHNQSRWKHRWFDFSVWRSFKHIHGGFDRRHIAPDAVVYLREDMKRYLHAAMRSIAEWKSKNEEPVVQEKEAVEVQYVNVGGRLQRKYASEGDSDLPPPTLSYLSQGEVEKKSPSSSSVRTSELAELEHVSKTCVAYCDECEFHPPPSPAPPSPDEITKPYPYPVENTGPIIPNPRYADRHSLAPKRAWQEAAAGPGGMAFDWDTTTSGKEGPPTVYPPGTRIPARLYSLLPSSADEESNGAAPVPGTASNNLSAASAAHTLLPGPRIRAFYRPYDAYQSVLEKCQDCNSYLQAPLRHAEGVLARSADDLHREHCHMSAVRSAKQGILRTLIEYVTVQRELEVEPTLQAMETILGQCWSCGLLMYETIEHLFDETVPEGSHSWDPLLEALKLQQWITGLQVGEEQVGRAALAYLLAHQAEHDQKETIRYHNAPFARAAKKPNSLWNDDRAFFILSPDNGLRSSIRRWVHSLFFENIVLAVIFLAAILLAIYTPGNADSTKNKVLRGFDDAVVVIFGLEMLLRWIADGVVLPAGSAYFWYLWNVVDFVILGLSIASWCTGSIHLRFLKVFRCFRLVGHMRYSEWEHIRLLSYGIWTSLPTLLNVSVLLLINYIIWAVIFVSMFFQKMAACSDPSIAIKNACLSRGFVWEDAYDRTFSDFLKSLLTSFEVSTGAEWMDIIYQAVDSWSTVESPRRNEHVYLGLVFVAFYCIGQFIFFSFMTSAVIHWYVKKRQEMVGIELTASPQLGRWQRMRATLPLFDPRIKLLPLASSLSHTLHHLVTHWGFEFVMAIILFIDAVLISLEWSSRSRTALVVVNTLQIICLGLFTIEIILRLIAHGTRSFTRTAFCWDMLVTVLGYLQIILNSTDNHYMPINVHVLRLLRVGRLLNLLCFFEKPRSFATLIHVTIMSAVWDLMAVSFFYALSIFVFAVAGLHILGGITPLGGFISMPYNNFFTFVNSLMMVFQLSTLENWSTMLRGSMHPRGEAKLACEALGGKYCQTTNWAPVYYIALFLCCFLLVSSLFMAVMHYHYLNISRMLRDVSKWKDLYHLRQSWMDEDPNASGVLPAARLPKILQSLPSPLGLPSGYRRVDLLRLLRAYNIPMADGEKVRYDDLLQAIARRVTAMAVVEKDLGTSSKNEGFEQSWRRVELELSVFDEERAATEETHIKQGYFELPTTVTKRLNSFKPQELVLPSNTVGTVEEYFAAAYIQAAYRQAKARRWAVLQRAYLWRHSQKACKKLGKSFSEYGFGRYPLDGPDPALEGIRRGFDIPSKGLGRRPPPIESYQKVFADPQQPRVSPRSGDRTGPLANSRLETNAGNPASSGQLQTPCPILPELYRPAGPPPVEEVKKKRFGPDVEGAIRRGERRSEKLAKDEREMNSPVSLDSSGSFNMSPEEETLASIVGGETPAEQSPPVGYQVPLGGDIEQLQKAARQ